MQDDKYTAAFDSRAKLITNLFIIGALSLLAFNAINPVEDSEIAYLGIFLLIPISIIAWGLHPQSYLISETGIKINRPFGSLSIPIDEIAEIRRVSSSELGFSLRLFASGGLFGYFGIYTSTAFGKYTMWCSNKDNLVLVVYNNSKTVISPSDPEGFIMNVKMRKFSSSQ